MPDMQTFREAHRRWDEAREEFVSMSRAALRGEIVWSLDEGLRRAAELDRLYLEFRRAAVPFVR
jgi:hypothetical protein